MSKSAPIIKASSGNYQRLDAEKLSETIERLHGRITARFPDSGLSRVCKELCDVSRQTRQRIAWVAKPIVALRIATFALIFLFIIVIGFSLLRLSLLINNAEDSELVQTLEAGTSELIVFGAGVFFFISLERRIKRGRALNAIHELRSVAHIIDMHQLTKDPEQLVRRGFVTDSASQDEKDELDAHQLARYLDYCSEMLSLTSKVATLYAQEFFDEVALSAVNEVETLTTGLSRKIWQKIMIINTLDPRLGVRPAN